MVAETRAIGFDAAADRYDADELRNPVIAHMRARAFRQLSAAWNVGARLLEIGSGTGTEAARLAAERGCRIALVDVSPQLLEQATSKLRHASPDGLLGAHVLRASAIENLVAVYGRESFDGAYSSFRPLNCEPRLEPVAHAMATLVRPGGAVVLSIMNRWCPSESVWFGLHGQWSEAARRWRGPIQATAYPGGAKDVTTWYYSRRDIERAFAPAFRLEHAEALPLLWPPSYLDFLIARHARLFRVLESIEEWAARQPLLRDLGDHVLVRLRRR